jgi:hypothetical protein
MQHHEEKEQGAIVHAMKKSFGGEKTNWAETKETRTQQIHDLECSLREAEADYARLRAGYTKLTQLL